ncbi:MAG TPA: nucleotide exchange factor GrpE [Ktedonobacterales bacterium]|nr:nucleotide exchange factor GrpE [Ktedonobacterales bacterium]
MEQETQTDPTQEPTSQQLHERIAELESQLTEMDAALNTSRQEAANNWDKYIRQVAEMDNFRKRQERMREDRIKRYKKDLLEKVVAVMDNLERAISYQDTMNREGLQQGMRMVQWQLSEILRSEGLTPVPALGQPFDPHIHEAVETVEAPDQPEGMVVEEVQKGYMMGEEMLRPARVKVSANASHNEG